MWDGLEGRKFPRVSAGCQIFIETLNDAQPVVAKTENIGAGGICVVLDRALQKFSKLRVELNLEDGGGSIVCNGRVVWNVESRDFHTAQSTFDTGIEFLNLSDDAAGRIRRLIEAQNGPVKGVSYGE